MKYTEFVAFVGSICASTELVSQGLLVLYTPSSALSGSNFTHLPTTPWSSRIALQSRIIWFYLIKKMSANSAGVT